jgi:hypothetical protein
MVRAKYPVTLPSGSFCLLERTSYTEEAMFEYPEIHEIRSASDVVHPASRPENPITAAYVLVSPSATMGLGSPKWRNLMSEVDVYLHEPAEGYCLCFYFGESPILDDEEKF